MSNIHINLNVQIEIFWYQNSKIDEKHYLI